MILRLWLLVVLTLAGAFAPSRAGARTAETRTWDFFAATANAHPENAPQVADSHLGNLVFGYELAPGYSQAAENALPRQTMATGKEWFDHFAGKYGAQNVEWTSGSGRTISWPSQLPRPATSEMIRVPPPGRSSAFVPQLESVAGPRPFDAIAHHTQPLGLNGVDNGLVNGSWVLRTPHNVGHGVLNPQVNSVPYGTWIIINH